MKKNNQLSSLNQIIYHIDEGNNIYFYVYVNIVAVYEKNVQRKTTLNN